jgi:hypothetical protein
MAIEIPIANNLGSVELAFLNHRGKWASAEVSVGASILSMAGGKYEMNSNCFVLENGGSCNDSD